MADYTLKLDIDAKLLEKKIKDALKNAGFGGGSSSGVGGGVGGGFGGKNQFDEKQLKELLKIYKELEDMKYAHGLASKDLHELRIDARRKKDMDVWTKKESQRKSRQDMKLAREGYMQNAKLFGIIGKVVGQGRVGGKVGSMMDVWSLEGKERNKKKEDFQGKYGVSTEDADQMVENFENKIKGAKPVPEEMKKDLDETKKKTPMAMKLIGIGAALGGAAGLGKMIIDSSPMLKSMMKLLNMGIMLILRPIGDFIGFMLRPLLIKFVTEVAVPAYKSGAKMAKEWGTKIGKVLLLLFTNPDQFLKGTLIDPLLGSLAKMFAGLNRRLQQVGVMLNPFIIDKDQAKDEIAAQQFDKSNPLSDQAINKQYPGFFYDEKGLKGGLLGDIGDTESGQRLQTLQEMTTEELNIGNQKTNTLIDKTKSVKDAIKDMEGTIYPWLAPQQDTADNTAELVRLAEAAAAAAEFDKKQATVASDIAQEFRDLCVEINSGYSGNKIIGSQEIERINEEKEKNTKQKAWEKQIGAFASGDYSSLSPAAQKALAKANEYKNGALGSGTSPQARGRNGELYNPLTTDQMGGVYGTGEFEKFDPGDGSTCLAGREIMGSQNFGADSREAMEQYSEAIEIAAEYGTDVNDEYKKILSLAEEAAKKQQEITTNVCLMESSSDIALGSTHVMEDNVDEMVDATKSMADNLKAQAEYVASLLKRASNLTYTSSDGRKKQMYPGLPDGDELCGAFGEGSYPHGSPNTSKMLKITFGDGTTRTQSFCPSGYADIMARYGQGKLYMNKTLLSVTRMASGGLISEPIFGIGQDTGKGYLMGEAGTERITPGAGTVSEQGGPIFNITINASNLGDVERQLKPAILKMLKESTSRAGIV